MAEQSTFSLRFDGKVSPRSVTLALLTSRPSPRKKSSQIAILSASTETHSEKDKVNNRADVA